MTNRVAATYDGSSYSGGAHTISFDKAQPGARLILVVSSWQVLSMVPAGWTQDRFSSGYSYVYVLSKVAAGTETSVSLLVADERVHAILYERDDAQQRLFATSATTSTASAQTPNVTIPAGATGFVVAGLNTPLGSVAGATWDQGLATTYSADADDSCSVFAAGPLPAAGTRRFSAGNLPAGESVTVVAVVGYGLTDVQAPTVPGNLRATSISGAAVSVEWDPSTDNIGMAGYGVYLGGVKQGADQAGTSHTFGGLVAGQTYTLEVDAVDVVGNRSARAQIVVLAETDVTPPSTPPNLRLVGATLTTVEVAWDASSDSVGVAGYGIYLDGAKQGGDQAGRTYLFSRLARGTTYLVEVDAGDSSGNRSARAGLQVETLAGADPSEPIGLTATPGEEQITLAWGAAEPGGLPIVRYEVLLDGQLVASTSGFGYIVEDLEAGGVHEVGVRAVDAGAARGPAATVTVRLPPASWTALATPTFRLGSWVGNARDSAGVDWVVKDEEGWSAGPDALTLSADSDSGDGGFSGAGRYGGRAVILSGVAVAPSRAAMLAAQDRLTAELFPAASTVLRVGEGHLTRQSRVRVTSAVEITDQGSRVFSWTVTVRAADPRRYATRPVHAEVEFAPAQTTGAATITLAGDYPAIPGRLRLIGPVADPVIRHEELGLQIVCKPGTVLPTSEYEITIDLATRAVWAIVPAVVWPEPRPGRKLLQVFPARFAFQRGPNTIRLSGGLVAGQEDVGPRLTLDTTDAWI
ncbi:fibronectin type III domain-containing protein (plasmid) [Actinomadura sp. ATCC 31491]|uniref:Fibronectin type III domain-containing protein n=1 Tax=Actinomadura luzonensis TaxID=2805427 RepID=A0ABT0GBU8_9ACTN|nr:fibronectin type III domain-containing protein [Actinomadura luzonensis]MCK2222072.1 fibronectin type III domain-containing protein [Actinomadura luzonensis]